MAKLTAADVRELRRLRHDGGWSAGRLAERSRVSVSAIHKALRGRHWPGVDGPKGGTDDRAKLKERDVRELRRLYRDGGWTLQRLAERYRVSVSAVHAAARGRSRSRVEDPAD